MSDVVFSPPQSGEIQIVHLTSGEDVVGVVTYDEARSGYKISDPMTPQVDVNSQKGEMRMGLLPIRPYYGSEKTKEIFVSTLHALYVTDLSPQMKEAYRQYRSKIILPNKKLDSLSSLLES